MNIRSKLIIFFIFIFVLFFDIDISFAEETSTKIISQIINEFNNSVNNWYGTVTGVATNIFALVILFEFLWTGTKAVIQQMPIKDLISNFVMVIISATVFFAIINNYQDWTHNIIFGLNKVIEVDKVNSDNPLIMGLNLCKTMFSKVSWTDIGLFLAVALSSFIIIISFALITSKLVVIKCEILVGMLVTLIIIPFGASQTFREYAINAIRYAVSVGFKLLTLNVIIGTSASFINSLDIPDKDMSTILTIIGFTIIILAITFTLPDTIASLISSAHGSAGGMLQAYNTVANTVTAGAATLGVGKRILGETYKGGMQGIRARGLARETAGSSWQGMSAGAKAWDTARAWNVGRQQASMNHSQIHRELKNNIMQLRQLRQQNQL